MDADVVAEFVPEPQRVAALIESPPGNAGWWLPVEPMLHISSRPEPWRGVLARLRSRAA